MALVEGGRGPGIEERGGDGGGPPDRPGLGVTLDEKFVKKYLVAESK